MFISYWLVQDCESNFLSLAAANKGVLFYSFTLSLQSRSQGLKLYLCSSLLILREIQLNKLVNMSKVLHTTSALFGLSCT